MNTSNRGRQASVDARGVASWAAGIAAVGLLVALALWWRGGREFPEVSSPESLHLMRALYTACSSQSDARLSIVEQNVAAAEQTGKLTDVERAAFDKIIEYARGADWQQAATESYRFAQDQVR